MDRQRFLGQWFHGWHWRKDAQEARHQTKPLVSSSHNKNQAIDVLKKSTARPHGLTHKKSHRACLSSL